ncbi:hypothetical protein Tco_1224746, partial [Tanacetum coccineum]
QQDVPTIQPQPVESTQGTNRTPRAHRTPNPATVFVDDVLSKKKKGKCVDGETSSPKPSLKVRFRQQPPSIPPPSYDKERDEIHEATLLSLTMHKTTKATEDQENVAIVLERILEEDIEKMVDDDDDSEATEFDGSEYFNDEEDSEKKYDKKDDDDGNDDDDHTHHASIKDQVSGSQQLRIEKMQTPIPSPHRSLRIDLSSDKDITQELKGIELFKGCVDIKVKNNKAIPMGKNSSKVDIEVQLLFLKDCT